MATVTKHRIKKSPIEVPGSLDHAAFFVSRVGNCQRRIDEIELAFKEKVARLEEAMAEELGPLAEERERLMDGLVLFAQPKRDLLIAEAGKKTIDLPTGKILWRFTPPSVGTRDTKKAVETLKSLGLDEYVRVKEELDKEGLLADREELDPIPGIKFTRSEEFVVVPNNHDREVVKTETIRLD